MALIEVVLYVLRLIWKLQTGNQILYHFTSEGILITFPIKFACVGKEIDLSMIVEPEKRLKRGLVTIPLVHLPSQVSQMSFEGDYIISTRILSTEEIRRIVNESRSSAA